MVMADVHGSPGAEGQMPQAGAGPAPVPYGGPGERPEPPDYGPMPVSFATPGVVVLAPAVGGPLQESAYAHDVNAGLVTQFYPGAISPIGVHGDADAGGRDDVSGTVAGAVGNAEARYLEHEGDTHATGSTIGDVMSLPANSMDPAVGALGPEGAYYDPPRNY